MAFQNITMNLSALQDISPPNITVGNTSLTGIVDVANESTGGYAIFGSMFVILIILFWVLSDKSPFQDFGYDYMRALNISLAVSLLIGLTIVEVGWSNNFYAVGMFTSLWLVSLFGIYIYENRE